MNSSRAALLRLVEQEMPQMVRRHFFDRTNPFALKEGQEEVEFLLVEINSSRG
jgi:hypothetical protein